MKNITIKLALAALTFAIGVWSTSFRSFVVPRVEVVTVTQPSLTSELNPQWIFIASDIAWKLPPKEIMEEMGKFYDGWGSFMIFYPTGDLTIINSDLRKDFETGQISLGGITGISIDKGTWSRNSDGTITTISHPCFCAVCSSSYPETQHRWITFGESRNRIATSLFTVNQSITALPNDFRDIESIKAYLKYASRCD